MENKENLFYQEQVALEGEIAMFLSTAPHDEEMLYRIFMMFENAPVSSLPYLLSEVKEQVEVDEEIINLVYLQARNHEVPVWLWLNRTKADIRECVEGRDLMLNPFKLSINKRKSRMKIVKSAFCLFLRRLCLINAAAASALINSILEDEDFKYLHAICTLFKDQLEELNKQRPPKKLIGKDILDISFDPKEILNFYTMLKFRETDLESPEKLENELFNLDSEDYPVIPNYQIKGIVEASESIIKQLSNIPEKEIEISNKFMVMKKLGNLVKVLKVFNTKEEAENYIKEIKEKAPDLKAEFEVKEVESRVIKGIRIS